jgi:hypothetical protein
VPYLGIDLNIASPHLSRSIYRPSIVIYDTLLSYRDIKELKTDPTPHRDILLTDRLISISMGHTDLIKIFATEPIKKL